MGDAQLVIVPSDGDGYMELARTKTGRLFRKHLLNKGPLRHPANGQIIDINDEFIAKLKDNFNNGVCDIVQVPLANAKNEHTEDPTSNIGEVVDIEVKGDKVYAVLDVRDPAHADKLGKTYLGASAMLSLDYTNTKTGEKVGPTLLHSCVTNRPYVTGLDDYEEIVAATTDSSEDAAVLLSDNTVVIEKAVPKPSEETEMPEQAETETVAKPSLEELLTALKTDHNIDVSQLQAQAGAGHEQAKLSQTIVDALTSAGVVKLSNAEKADGVATDTVVAAVQELATNNVSLSHRIAGMEKREAEHLVDGLIEHGRLMPAQRDVFVEMKLTAPAMFDKAVPATAIVKLSNEQGVNVPKDEAQKYDIDAEITRLSALVK
jgi:hypothetical protein